MAIGRTNAGGGGFNKSVIIVTAPTGSTVTCTKGTTVKTATEKNGEWWFKNLDLGEWTLKATLSGQTATQTVNITQFGVYRIAMSYFKSTIKVTYPAGSTCTCSKGEEVLTAPNTSGSYTFTVTSAGTWVIKITSGRDSASKSVSITKTGQSVSVSIDYVLWLFDNGDQFTENTGGWYKRTDVPYRVGMATTGTTTIDDTISVSAGGGVSSSAWTQSLIDLTNYKTLTCTSTKIGGADQDLAIMPASGAKSIEASHVASMVIRPGTNNLDVSSLDGKYYVVFSAANGRSFDISSAKLIM